MSPMRCLEAEYKSIPFTDMEHCICQRFNQSTCMNTSFYRAAISIWCINQTVELSLLRGDKIIMLSVLAIRFRSSLCKLCPRASQSNSWLRNWRRARFHGKPCATRHRAKMSRIRAFVLEEFSQLQP